MAKQKTPKIEQDDITRAEDTWNGFMAITKLSTYAVCAILVALYLYFFVL